MQYYMPVVLLAIIFPSRGASISLQPVYVGSSQSQVQLPTTPGDPTGLTALDFSQVAAWAPEWFHVFKVAMEFGSLGTGEDFRAITFGVEVDTAAFQIVNQSGQNPTALQPAWRSTTAIVNAPIAGPIFPFSQNLDMGSPNDLQGIWVMQSYAAYSYELQNGEPGALAGQPTTLGYFFLRFKPEYWNPGATAVVTAERGVSDSFGYWSNNEEGDGNPVATSLGIETGSFSFVYPASIPEPFSLGMHFLSSVAMLSQRRPRRLH